jgi:hypothetical protein
MIWTSNMTMSSASMTTSRMSQPLDKTAVMLKKGQVLGQARTDAIIAFMLETLKPPGLRPIKQVELFKKCRPFVPIQFWAETCPRPSDEIMLQIKDDSAEKRKKKTLGNMQAVAPTPAATAKSAAATAKASTVFSKASAKAATGPAAPKRSDSATAKEYAMAATRPVAAKPSGKKKRGRPQILYLIRIVVGLSR